MRVWLRSIAAGMVVLAVGAAQAAPSFHELRAAHRPSDLSLLDRHGTPLQTLRTDPYVRRLQWVPLQEMSPALLQALVLSEDQRFWQHSGIDWAGVARSAWANAWNHKTQGASTLTMQLAGLIDEGLARPATGRTVGQKLGQAYTATQLERGWSKHQILEAYLNSVPLRGELVGIEALAQTLFQKHASGLDAQEAALAAALVRAPNASAARVAERGCGILQLQTLPCTGLRERAEAAFARKGGSPLGEQLAPHLARQMVQAQRTQPTQPNDPAPVMRSTLDARLQRLAVASLREQLAALSRRNVEDGAIIVLDNRSGEVLAWVGSSGSAFSDAPQVDGVLALRQPGSTLKPFVYQLAIEQRLLTAASLLDDSPEQIATGGGLYVPQNYDRRFRGWVSARQALAGSLNVPAVRAAALLPPQALVERLNALGMRLPHTGGYYGQALALGSAEVSLLDLSNAYRTLANGGVHSAVSTGLPRTVATPARTVAPAHASFIVADILADNAARAPSFGLDSALTLPGWAAVKTGTSKDMRDNWCIGFSSRYTVGVWVGNASGAPMHDVSGVSGAAPIWRRLMLALHDGAGWGTPTRPQGLVLSAIAHADGREPRRNEWFIPGTELATVHPVAYGVAKHSAQQSFGISHPLEGSIFALDPDIPPTAQRLVIEGEAGQWRLNGKRLVGGTATAGPSPNSTRHSWPLWPGRHRLEWTSANGQNQQTVNFEVRGAGLKPSARPGSPATRQALSLR